MILDNSIVQVLDHGYVRLIQEGCWGSDELFIEAARQSTGKGFLGWGSIPCPSCDTLHDTGCPMCKGKMIIQGDEKLLSYLYNHKHMTPFEMGGLTFQIQAPIFVFREWHRHRTQSYNEMSGRYIELPSLGYIPSVERIMAGRQSFSNKQSSETGFSFEEASYLRQYFIQQFEDARNMYDRLLKNGVAKELARLVIPVNQYSRMMASANLRNWLNFLILRDDPAAQWEIQQYAKIVGQFVSERFPKTYELFEKGRKVSKLSYQELDSRMVGLEQGINNVAQALTWLMLMLKHTTPSPIIGGEPVSRSLLDLYKEEMAKIALKQEIKDIAHKLEEQEEVKTKTEEKEGLE